jgi:hypothetical protein
MTFTVLLAKYDDTLATVGSTEDVIEAGSVEEAEHKAIEAWLAADPRYGYRPLFTRQHDAAL